MSKKISGNISAIKTVLSGAGIKAQKGARTTKKMTSYLLELFSTIDDPRIHGMSHYPLDYILLISFLAVLGGAENWVEISDFGNGMKRWLG